MSRGLKNILPRTDRVTVVPRLTKGGRDFEAAARCWFGEVAGRVPWTRYVQQVVIFNIFVRKVCKQMWVSHLRQAPLLESCHLHVPINEPDQGNLANKTEI